MDEIKELSQIEKEFCELYVNGTSSYAGNAAKCYADLFQDKTSRARGRAMKLLNQPHIQKYISDLEAEEAYDSARKRNYLARHLEGIIEETCSSVYTDRRGNKLSPAALRSVGVQAMKLYADLFPVKESQVSKINIEGNTENGITFNVIVPSAKSED